MEKLFAMDLNCPHCSESLMDKDILIDNEPSVRMDASIRGKTFWLRLSSVWGSFNYQSEEKIKSGDSLSLSCPHCFQDLQIDSKCEVCNSHKAQFALSEMGKIYICPQKGCYKHSIEIEDLMSFLKAMERQCKCKTSSIKEKGQIEQSVFLDSYCPHCHKSMIEDELITINIINDNDEKGVLCLSPYLNVFTHRTDVELAEGFSAKELNCNHCSQSLIVNKECPECNAKVASFEVKAMDKNISFEICSKKGCTWHGTQGEDLEKIFLQDSIEW